MPQPDDAPPWLYYHSPGFFALQRGLAYRYLASDPAYRTRAEAALAAGHAQLPPGDQSSEWGAEFLVYLADVHARGGDLEQACAIALVAATAGRQMDSARLLGMLRRLRAGLAASLPSGTSAAAHSRTASTLAEKAGDVTPQALMVGEAVVAGLVDLRGVVGGLGVAQGGRAGQQRPGRVELLLGSPHRGVVIGRESAASARPSDPVPRAGTPPG